MRSLVQFEFVPCVESTDVNIGLGTIVGATFHFILSMHQFFWQGVGCSVGVLMENILAINIVWYIREETEAS